MNEGNSIMRAIVVDDEDLARGIVREYLASFPDVQIVGECSNGFDAVKAITELKPDLLFLDIQMPKLNGFEVLDLLDAKPRVIFVTAYDSYAIKAFEVNAIDYLLKPFSRERFEKALLRVAGKEGRTAGRRRQSDTQQPIIECADRTDTGTGREPGPCDPLSDGGPHRGTG